MTKQTKITKSARGQQCQIRIEDVCNGNPETVVLCHRWGGGMGGKSKDLFGVYGCSDCHNEVDRKTRKKPKEFAELCFYDGMVRTQLLLLEQGLIEIK